MMQIIPIGVGAGAAAALLSASIASGSLLATFLFYLAPLPILIAGLGWSHWAALVAAITGAAGLAAVLGLFYFAAFLIGIGIPAWWLSYLAMLARPAARPTEDGLEWYPVGRLVYWAALIGFLVVLFAVPTFGTDQESFETTLRTAFERTLRAQTPETGPRAPSAVDRGIVLDFLVAVLPPLAAVLSTVTNVFNLWLAGRVVSVSGRLKRPWPDLSAIKLPGHAPLLLVAAIAAVFLPGLAGILARVLAASLLMAFAILGFSVLHAITVRINSRFFVLAAVYTAVILAWPIVIVVSMLGIADSVFDIRRRRSVSKPGPPSQPT
jgi:hypothetical protein